MGNNRYSELMAVKNFTQDDLIGFEGKKVQVSVCLGNTYEGHVIDVTEQGITLVYPNYLGNRMKEVKIDMGKIDWVEAVEE